MSRGRDSLRLDVAIRVLALLALSMPALWTRNTTSVLGLVTLALIWTGVSLSQSLPVPESSLDIVEGALVGVVAGLTASHPPTLFGALAVPPLTTGLRSGLRPALRSLAASLTAAVAATAVFVGLNAERGSGILSWSVAGLGVALITGSLHSTRSHEPDPLRPYRDARALMQELLGLSGGLKSGLDPEQLAGHALAVVRDAVPVTSAAVVVPREGDLVVLVGDPAADDQLAEEHDALASQALTGKAHLADGVFAIPLTTDAGTIGAVVGTLPAGLDPTRVELRTTLEDLPDRLEGTAVRLDAALLFAAFRDEATVDERRRLAREMHDGVAQDIASLGYLVDALAAGPMSPEQSTQLRDLRQRITSVVAEVRRSVLKLRSQAAASESLGAAIGSLARHLSQLTGIRIHVSVSERTARLRPEVEAELLRITQEALNNAVRHASPNLIEVTCEVAPPAARIVIRDDGPGLGAKRSDSHGLTIMAERAHLIGATLGVGEAPTGGVVIDVRLGETTQLTSPQPTPESGMVTP